MQKKPLIELLHDLEQELLRDGYTAGSMQFYRRRWKMLLQFAQEQGEAFYSEQLGLWGRNKCAAENHRMKEVKECKSCEEAQEKMRVWPLGGDVQA